jgi:hypothetical protein
MKIGLRLGKCVLDIIKGDVLLTDVLVIVANSKINPNKDDQWTKIWNSYKNESKIWDIGIHEEVFKYTLRRLYDLGKLHQPRIYGGKEHNYVEAWVDVVPTLNKMVAPPKFVAPRKVVQPAVAATIPPRKETGQVTKPAPLLHETAPAPLPEIHHPLPELPGIIPDFVLQ